MRRIKAGFKLLKIFYASGCTIIIPTWNCVDTLAKCLLSIPDAFPDDVKLEIIFIDKGSNDGTLSCIEYYMKEGKLDQIPYKIITEPGKLGKARLYGIQHAKYKTIFWLDSDIVLPKNYISDLFVMAADLYADDKIPLLSNIFGLQGWMDCRNGIDKKRDDWHKWWHGFERGNFDRDGYNLGCPTANLLVLNDYRLTPKERQELATLPTQEDNYLGRVVRKMGYEIYVMDIPTPHLKFEAQRTKGNQDYEILWLLTGERGMGRTKLQALWHYKWVLFRGLRAWQITPEFKMLTMSLKVYLNAIRLVLIKDKKLLSQERLKELKDW